MATQRSDLESLIKLAMLRDQYRLRRQLRQAARSKSREAEIDTIESAIRESIELREKRQSGIPTVCLDQDLPIFQKRREIADALERHQVIVVSGATGSGKSTQLPLIAMEAGFGVAGLIGHTQPRRIAARGVAARIADQLKTRLGNEIGFKIRFADQTSDQTYVKLMTDGILLAETQSDRFLEQYDLIIVDEAHERSLNIDFLLGYLKRILGKRKQFRLVITSATIDTERFSQHFSVPGQPPVPIIDVEGRTYPVEIEYRPLENGESAEYSDKDFEDHVVEACRELVRDGDVLVFLPTENDIRSVHKRLRSLASVQNAPEILPLYARLSTAQQNQIFSPGKRSRVVLATNVAESSITVPRIRFVVDTGTARISHYAPRSKVQRLPIQSISQASANQRAGRCGRIGPGRCVRLYSQEDYESRAPFTTPEIRRTNLASVILQTLALKLGRVDEFPFIDPPRPEAIRDGYKTLYELGAVDERRNLTHLGKRLARLPVDPRIGRMLFAAQDENCVAEILIIASALEIQDPRIRPAEKRKSADAAHEKFRHAESDFLSLLKIWDFFHHLKSDLSKSKLRKACEQNYLSFSLMRQWQDIHRQLRSMANDQKLVARKRKDDYAAIHKSLLAGLLSGIAKRGDRHEFTGAGGIKFHLWPGSGVFETKPQWVVVAEVVETSKRYGRTVARINPAWIEPLSKHLTKSRFTDPVWSKKKQTVVASEHVSLWGLPIVSGRKVNYGTVEPEICRDIFIEQGLVQSLVEPTFDFLEHNHWLTSQIEGEAAKTRDRELVIDSFVIEAFYKDRLPTNAFDRNSLNRLLKSDNALDANLRMTREDLLPGTDMHSTSDEFPDRVEIGSMQIPVNYRFSPGSNDDGATIQIPVEAIGQMDDAQAGWLIPGFMQSQVVALIRSLPKSIRRNLVPAPETAESVVANLPHGSGHFLEAVARELSRHAGIPIEPTMFKTQKIDDHLKVNMQVVDTEGAIVAEGRSLSQVRGQLGAELVTSIVEVSDEKWNQDSLVDWDWEEFPKETTIQRGATRIAAYPTIIDQNDSVGLRLSDSRSSSDFRTRQGLVRLFQLQNRKNVKSQVNWLPDIDRHAVSLSPVVSNKNLKTELADLIVRIAFVDTHPIPRSEDEFRSRQQNAVERIGMAAQEVAKWLPKLSDEVLSSRLSAEGLTKHYAEIKQDVTTQLSNLLTASFLSHTPWQWLKHFPRYLAAVTYRLERLASTDPEKDRQFVAEIQEYWNRYTTTAAYQDKQAIVDPELDTFRWMIEEFRVSLFAQGLGTSIKVSPQRLDKQWSKVRQV